MQSNDPAQVCEKILIAEKHYNIEHKILPSENAIVDRLLARRVELLDAYKELHDGLHKYPYALKTFLGLLLNTAAFWNPKRAIEAREEQERLTTVNKQIARTAAELARLISKRTELHNRSGFSSNTYYHVCDAIEAAGTESNPLFGLYVREGLRSLRSQFDLKYWPELSEVVRALAIDAGQANTGASDTLTAAATVALRASRADFFSAFFVAIEESSGSNHGFLPKEFKLTDNTYASLANCALDLGSGDLVDGGYVKRLRQRLREGKRAEQREMGDQENTV